MTRAAQAWTQVGGDLPRADGVLKVTGAATYAAEWQVPGVSYGAVVGSAIARGIIRSIEVDMARAAPGVIVVVTHENSQRLAPYPAEGGGFQLSGEGGLGEALQPLQNAEIYYAGQTVAVVVAETFEQARHAATLVRVAYDALLPELDLDRASLMSFPEMFAGVEPLQKDATKARAAFAAAPVQVKADFETSIQHHNPIELLATIAQWEKREDGDYLTLHDSTRATRMLGEVVAKSFRLPVDHVRVIAHFIGGAFGSKAWSFHVPMIAALASRCAQRPVKIEWSRQSIFAVGGHRPALRQSVRIGASEDGKFAAIFHDSRTHSSLVSGYTEFGARMTRMMYATEIAWSSRLSHLNLPSPAVMRGPGFQMGSFALESTLDELARALDMDPIALRLANHADDDPDSGLPFSSKHLRDCYAKGRTLFGWSQRAIKPYKVGNSLIGEGMASVMHPADRAEAHADATIFADGTALVRCASHELGNGTYTIFRQIAADGLGIPLERVRVELGDSSFPLTPPTHGSITTATVGPAVLDAARSAIICLKELALQDPWSPLQGAAADAIDSADGRLFLRDNHMRFDDHSEILHRAGLPSVTAHGSADPSDTKKKHSFYSFGAIFAEVRVDPDTGVVRVARLCGVYDAGRVVNPRTARSQLLGGIIFGLGATLSEETVFDPNNGLPVVRNLADYHVPTCADVPAIVVELLDIPDPNISEIGARGVGEMGCNGVSAAIANAIFDATGVRLRSLPITPDKILKALGKY